MLLKIWAGQIMTPIKILKMAIFFTNAAKVIRVFEGEVERLGENVQDIMAVVD